MPGFVPIATDALALVDRSMWGAVTDLYQRAHALRWQQFQVTEASLATAWGCSTRQVWSLLGILHDAGLLVLEKGDRRKASRVLVIPPTRTEAQHVARDTARHNSSAGTPVLDESVAQGVAQGVALLLRGERESQNERSPLPPAARGELTEWVSNTLVASLREIRDEVDDGGDPERLERAVLRLRRCERDTVVYYADAIRQGINGWAGAPGGAKVRQADVAAGVKLAVERWDAERERELPFPPRALPGGR